MPCCSYVSQIKPSVRLRFGSDLARLICKGADGHPAPLGEFMLRPQYGSCQALEEAMSSLSLGGSIVYKWGTPYFHASPHTKGAYGQSRYLALSPELKEPVDRLAERLAEKFA